MEEEVSANKSRRRRLRILCQIGAMRVILG